MVLSEMQDFDIEDLGFHSNGWSSQCTLDHHGVSGGGLANEGGREEPEAEGRTRAEAFIALKDKLSTRLRTYIRVAGIGTTNNAKVGWGTMTAQCENTGASAERLTAVVFTISTFVGALGRIAKKADSKDKASHTTMPCAI